MRKLFTILSVMFLLFNNKTDCYAINEKSEPIILNSLVDNEISHFAHNNILFSEIYKYHCKMSAHFQKIFWTVKLNKRVPNTLVKKWNEILNKNKKQENDYSYFYKKLDTDSFYFYKKDIVGLVNENSVNNSIGSIKDFFDHKNNRSISCEEEFFLHYLEKIFDSNEKIKVKLVDKIKKEKEFNLAPISQEFRH